MSNHLLSEVEELVLLAAGFSRDEAYGYAVKKNIYEQSRRSFSLPTVHAALYRLEKKGFLSSSLGGATTERGGRRKRLFTITNTGLQVLRTRANTRNQMWEAVQRVQSLGGAA